MTLPDGIIGTHTIDHPTTRPPDRPWRMTDDGWPIVTSAETRTYGSRAPHCSASGPHPLIGKGGQRPKDRCNEG